MHGQEYESPQSGGIMAKPKLPPSEKAELQVSLLNEIGLTLTAMAKEQIEQAETLKTYKLSLEGIQGLLVDNEAGIGTLGEGIAAILARLDHDSIAGLSERLGRIEERLERNGKVPGPLEWDWATAAYIVNGKRITPELIEVVAMYGVNADMLQQQVAKLEQRIGHMGAQLTVMAQEQLANKPAIVKPKPRKAGKRPVRKAGKRLKTSKL